MKAPMPTRREFIKNSAALLLTAGVMGSESFAQAAEKRARWTVACRDQHLKATGKPDCWSAAKSLNLEGLEVIVTPEMQCPSLYHPGKKYSVASAEGIQTLQADARENGIVLTSFAMSNRLDEQLARELEWMKKLAPVAQKLGMKAIRIDVVPRALKREEFLPFAIRACRQLCEIVEGTGVRLGIENHGNTTNNPEFLEKLFDGVGSSQLGLTLDPANFYWFGIPLNELYGIYEKFAPRSWHTHCKSIRFPEEKRNVRRTIGWEYDKYSATIYDGDIDYKRVAGILRKASYKGDLCLENESLGHFPKAEHGDVLKKEIAVLSDLAK